MQVPLSGIKCLVDNERNYKLKILTTTRDCFTIIFYLVTYLYVN